MYLQTGVVVQKFASFMPRVRQEKFEPKPAPESWICSVLSKTKFAGEGAAKCCELRILGH